MLLLSAVWVMNAYLIDIFSNGLSYLDTYISPLRIKHFWSCLFSPVTSKRTVQILVTQAVYPAAAPLATKPNSLSHDGYFFVSLLSNRIFGRLGNIQSHLQS